MKRVITYGTFDLLHYGHIHLLRRAKALGDYLIVGLSTDDFNWNEKHKKCYFSYEQRKALLESIVTAEVKRIMEERKRQLAEQGQEGLVFFDIPLLFEYGCEGLCDAVWTVSAEG